MRLKYYLRGLGIGILVTALILIAAPGEKEVLSDAEIRERAYQLGMVDGKSLTLADVQDVQEKAPSDAQEPKVEAPVEDVPETKEEMPVADASEPVDSQETDMQEQTEEMLTEDEAPVEEQQPLSTGDAEKHETTAEYAVITIKSGANSYTVAKSLEEAGLVPDAKEFDRYLCDNGYSRRISTGTYEIAVGTTKEEIAKIISGKR